MKIISMAVILLVLFIPMYLTLDFRTAALGAVLVHEDKYNAALKTATQDAASLLNTSSMSEYSLEEEVGYGYKKAIKANKELALDTFYRTLYLNFNVVNDPIGQGTLNSYIPAIVVTDYDGYYLYVMSEFKGSDGQFQYKHTWRPKKPYAFADTSGNTINFSLDGYVKVYEKSTRKWIEGYQVDLAGKTSVKLLDDTKLFEEKRRQTIVSNVQKDLEFFIDKHNEFASKNGVSYIFTLPTIDQEEWTNTIDDVGILAFLQGIPIGDQYYNNYAFGSGRILANDRIIGAIDESNGMKYAYSEKCTFPYKPQEHFSTTKAAAKAGYYIKECINGN